MKHQGKEKQTRPSLSQINKLLWGGIAIIVIAYALIFGVHLLRSEKAEDSTESLLQSSEKDEDSEDALLHSSGKEDSALPLQFDETNDRLIGITEQYTFDIPADMEDAVKVTLDPSGGNTVFYCSLPDIELPVFQLSEDPANGFEVGKITSDGETKTIYAQMYSPPESIGEDEENSFYAVQELVNELLISENVR